MTTSKFLEEGIDRLHDPLTDTPKEYPGQTGSDTHAAEPPYSVFHRRQLTWIIAIAAFAGWFSSASSFIYFPAIPFMAKDLGISVEKVNLTVTSYLVASGIFPSVTGSAADIYGRRPVLIVSLGAYTVVNVALALQGNFVALFVLRMVQSMAISVSIAYGVMGDVTTPATRGGYSGMLSLFINTPPSVAPLISGLLLIRWTWPSIFWLLTVLSPVALLAVVLWLPETCRNIVGNGSRPLPKLRTAILPHLKAPSDTYAARLPKSARRFPNPIKVFLLLKHRGSLVTVCCFGIAYSVYSCLQASLSTVFVEIYGVSGLAAGLIYLPFGAACMISAWLAGRLLDRDYAVTAREQGVSIDRVRGDDLTSFPVERARLRNSKFSIALCSALIVGYGWALQAKTHMAIPLVIQFFIGFLNQFVFTTLHTLLIDYNPNDSSSIQAASNFVRCELAAALLGVLDRMFKSLGLGWTFVILGGFHLVMLPVLWVLERRGLQWRSKKGAIENGPP